MLAARWPLASALVSRGHAYAMVQMALGVQLCTSRVLGWHAYADPKLRSAGQVYGGGRASPKRTLSGLPGALGRGGASALAESPGKPPRPSPGAKVTGVALRAVPW